MSIFAVRFYCSPSNTLKPPVPTPGREATFLICLMYISYSVVVEMIKHKKRININISGHVQQIIIPDSFSFRLPFIDSDMIYYPITLSLRCFDWIRKRNLSRCLPFRVLIYDNRIFHFFRFANSFTALQFINRFNAACPPDWIMIGSSKKKSGDSRKTMWS